MASSAEYLEYVLDLLAEVPEVSTRKMMGEYLLYASGKLFGGAWVAAQAPTTLAALRGCGGRCWAADSMK